MTKALDIDAARHAFESALRDHRPAFETFFLARLFGLEFTYDAETCTVRFPVHDFMSNPQGSLHGGVIAFALDVSMGHLLNHSLGLPGATIEMKTQYFAPVRGPLARCEARFLHKAKGIVFLESRMFDGDGTLVAAATSTWRARKPAAAGAESAIAHGERVESLRPEKSPTQ